MSEQEFRPSWAPHVVGRFPERTANGDGGFEVQLVKMTCENCGGIWQVPCTSGGVRQHVLNFALGHVHRNVFRDPHPGAKRR